jgi:hypothetical protein
MIWVINVRITKPGAVPRILVNGDLPALASLILFQAERAGENERRAPVKRKPSFDTAAARRHMGHRSRELVSVVTSGVLLNQIDSSDKREFRRE